jgi:catechol 2,3-dioxygenase-like lactoylglutathione lyase family enzyme
MSADTLDPARSASDDLELEAGLVCRDLPRMERFCVEVLGFEVSSRLDFDRVGRIVKLRRDRARIKLFGPQGGVDPAVATGPVDPWYTLGGWRYVAIYMAAPGDVQRLTDAIVDDGGAVLLAPTEHRAGARAALVTDPEGNAWELLWEQGSSPA